MILLIPYQTNDSESDADEDETPNCPECKDKMMQIEDGVYECSNCDITTPTEYNPRPCDGDSDLDDEEYWEKQQRDLNKLLNN